MTGLQLLMPIAFCNPAGEPVVCEEAMVDTGAAVSGLPSRLLAPLELTEDMCFPLEVGGVTRPERIPLPQLGFAIETHCLGRRTLVRPIISDHAERAWLGMDLLRHWTLTVEGWSGRIGLVPHPELPAVHATVEDALQRNLDALEAA